MCFTPQIEKKETLRTFQVCFLSALFFTPTGVFRRNRTCPEGLRPDPTRWLRDGLRRAHRVQRAIQRKSTWAALHFQRWRSGQQRWPYTVFACLSERLSKAPDHTSHIVARRSTAEEWHSGYIWVFSLVVSKEVFVGQCNKCVSGSQLSC